MTLRSQPGTENNKVKIGGKTTLHGDPKIKPEKPYTIIGFPGGDVEISRTSDNKYWIHVRVEQGSELFQNGVILDARVDAKGRYTEINDVLRTELDKGDIDHIAFLVGEA